MNTNSETIQDRAYMIIPEPHIWDKNIKTRKNYVKEIKGYMIRVRDLAQQISSTDKEVIIIFMGDIFHKGMKSTKENIYWYQYFLTLNTVCSSVYSCIGNHELSYREDNLFWHLCTTTEDTCVRNITAYGEFPLIRVVDTIEDQDVTIHLNHHDVLAPVPREKNGIKHVGLFHHGILETEIANVLRNKYNRDPLENYIDHTYVKSNKPLQNYDYAFIGHMHKAYGLFTIEDERTGQLTRLRYLASLGRTNRDEVNDEDLDRVIPVIEVSDNKPMELKEIPFKLNNYEDTISDEIVQINKEEYERTKENRELKRLSDTTGQPLIDLRQAFINNDKVCDVINNAMSGVVPQDLASIRDIINTSVDWKGCN